MSRRITAILGALVVAAIGVAPTRAEEPSSRPNILFIVIDNVGYGDLGCYGNPINRTPNMDRLAAQGVRLTQFYIGSPSCSPSRGSFLTGRHPIRNGLNWQLKPEEQLGRGLPLDEKIIPAYLKPLAYATGAFGKWNIGFGPGGRPTDRGFDVFFGHASGNIDYYHHLYNGRLDTYRGTENVRVEGYSTDLFADAAIDFIQAHAKDHWFCYIPFNAAHVPNPLNTPPREKTGWQVPEKYLRLYGWAADESDERRRFAAVMTALDDAIGRVLKKVSELNLDEKTFVFLMSDNGGGHDRRTGGHVTSNGGLRGGITMCYEGGIRVPAMARWPGHIPAGTVSNALLWSMDLLPTFVAAAGGTLPDDRAFDGIDIRGVLAGGPGPRREFFWDFRSFSAVRSGTWKLVRSENNGAWELYDVSIDSGERNDLAKSHPNVVMELSSHYAQWFAATKRR
jgi:arylsulfatase A-like enzyme